MSTGILAEILGPDGLIMIVVLAILLIFGGSRLPKLARGLGSASHEFRRGMAEGDAEDAALGSGTQKASDPAIATPVASTTD